MYKKRAFTLVELLVVIGIISILAVIVVINLSNARAKSRDARRKADVTTLSDVIKLRFIDTGNYPKTSGYVGNPDEVLTDNATDSLTNPPAGQSPYISTMPIDPSGSRYMYYRKDTVACLTNLGAYKYAVYTKLENPAASDTATLSDSYDTCIGTTYSMNFRVGN